MMDKNYLVEIQRFVNDGGQLTHEQGVRFFEEFLKQGGRLSHDDSLMLLHKLGELQKKRKLPRLRVVPVRCDGSTRA